MWFCLERFFLNEKPSGSVIIGDPCGENCLVVIVSLFGDGLTECKLSTRYSQPEIATFMNLWFWQRAVFAFSPIRFKNRVANGTITTGDRYSFILRF